MELNIQQYKKTPQKTPLKYASKNIKCQIYIQDIRWSTCNLDYLIDSVFFPCWGVGQYSFIRHLD